MNNSYDFQGTVPDEPPAAVAAFIREAYKGFFAHKDANSGSFTANCILTTDIDLGGHQWTPIGIGYGGNSTEDMWFRGTFDGGGHSISGVNVFFDEASEKARAATTAGLFGEVRGTVQNLHVEGAVSATYDQTEIGGVVGNIRGNLSGVSADMAITIDADPSHASVGGIAGIFEGLAIFDVVNAGDVNAREKGVAGGIAGRVHHQRDVDAMVAGVAAALAALEELPSPAGGQDAPGSGASTGGASAGGNPSSSGQTARPQGQQVAVPGAFGSGADSGASSPRADRIIGRTMLPAHLAQAALAADLPQEQAAAGAHEIAQSDPAAAAAQDGRTVRELADVPRAVAEEVPAAFPWLLLVLLACMAAGFARQRRTRR